MTTIEVNGRNFEVAMPDFKKEIAGLEAIKTEYMAGNMGFNPLWEREESKAEDVFADLASLTELLERIEANPDVLIPFVEEVRKKKNGGFWRNSGTDVRVAQNCTEYFTDYTNAWSALMIRLDVLDENTCELSVRNRTFTL